MKASHFLLVLSLTHISCTKDVIFRRQYAFTQFNVIGKVIRDTLVCGLTQRPIKIELIYGRYPDYAPNNIIYAFSVPDSLKIPNQLLSLDFDPVYPEQNMERDCNGNIIPNQVIILKAAID